MFKTKLNSWNNCIVTGNSKILIKQKFGDSSDLALVDKDRKEKACIESLYIKNTCHHSNIIVKQCYILIRPISICQSCYDYRKNSSATLQKVMKSNFDSSSCRKFTPNKKLLKSQLKSKASAYVRDIKLLKQQTGIQKTENCC